MTFVYLFKYIIMENCYLKLHSNIITIFHNNIFFYCIFMKLMQSWSIRDLFQNIKTILMTLQWLLNGTVKMHCWTLLVDKINKLTCLKVCRTKSAKETPSTRTYLLPHNISGLHDASWGQAVITGQKNGLFQRDTQSTTARQTINPTL